MTFSPDGVLVATARSDNRTQLFDIRMMNRVLYDLRHEPAPAGMETDGQFGVWKVDWLEDPWQGLQLVSGGADGAFLRTL